MKKQSREVWISDDNKVFETEAACAKHEQDVRDREKRIENLKCYKVSHSFDATEGRGYYGSTLIVTDQSYPVVLQYCLEKFGKPLQEWYNKSYYEAWLIYQSPNSAKDALKNQEVSKSPFGYNSNYKNFTVFISNKEIDFPDLPKPVMPKW